MIERPVFPKRRPVWLTIWMILSQVLMLASLLIWLPVAGLSVMAFDSGQSVEAWAIVILAWSYPIVPIILIIGAWIAYAKYKNAPAAVLAGLSFAPPILGCLFVTLANAAWFAQNGGLAPFGR